jgi:chromosome segregation ATPase
MMRMEEELKNAIKVSQAWYLEASRLKNQVADLQNQLHWESLSAAESKKEAQALRKALEHSENELGRADESIHGNRDSVRRLLKDNDELRREIYRLECKVRDLSPPLKRGTVQYGRYEPLTITRSKISRDEIFQQWEANSYGLEAQSQEQLSRICALFDGDAEEIENLGRGHVESGDRLHRPGAWTLAGLAMRDK